MSGFWDNPAVIGLIIALPATILGYLGYRHSKGIDAAALQAETEAGEVTSVQQVIDGLSTAFKNVQSDNSVLREEIKEIRARLDVIEALNDDLRFKNHDLENEILLLKSEIIALKASR